MVKQDGKRGTPGHGYSSLAFLGMVKLITIVGSVFLSYSSLAFLGMVKPEAMGRVITEYVIVPSHFLVW